MAQPAALDMFPDALGDPDRAGITPPDAKWPANLAAMVDVLHATLRERGHDDDAALDDAEHCAIAIAEYQGGRNYYLPTGKRLNERHLALGQAHSLCRRIGGGNRDIAGAKESCWETSRKGVVMVWLETGTLPDHPLITAQYCHAVSLKEFFPFERQRNREPTRRFGKGNFVGCR